ncbi:hypothetical protein GTY54_16090 [Streptomyces sp. SID625]|nr:hypothetical protein [Streptomyces sp. SID625]
MRPGPCSRTPLGLAHRLRSRRLQSAYGLTSADSSAGSGRTIAIVDTYDDPNAESRLAAYHSN